MPPRKKEVSNCFVNPRRGWKAYEKITLWSRCAGRCERCNESIIRNRYSGDVGNYGEFAHIIAHSEGGNRSNKGTDYSQEYVDDIQNIIVLCTSCHTNIDKKENESKYTEEYLQKIKAEHIEKIYYQTLPTYQEKRQVIVFTCPIGNQTYSVSDEDTRNAMSPAYFPDGERATRIDINTYREESQNAFWENTQDELIGQFNRLVLPMLKNGVKFAVFAIAPMPLLVQFGTLLRSVNSTIVYNLFHRSTEPWKWLPSEISEDHEFRVNRYSNGVPRKKALVISLSASIIERVCNELSSDYLLWEVTIDNPEYDCIKSLEQLSSLAKVFRQVLEDASKQSGSELGVYMCAPNSVAVTLGMSYMPKCNDSLVIYDYISSLNKDIKTINIKSI